MIDSPPSIRQAIDEIATDPSAETQSGWFFNHQVHPAERAAVLRNVMLNSNPRWFVPFVVMLALSAGIATLGLSQDSAATVIGAMVVAPLGQPIAALGGAIALAWPRQTARMLLTILAGAALVVGLSYLLGVFLPTATPTGQILARTSPDLRDLGVAVFAGSAGAYALTRTELASALTGVAIAVALVPPLATVGLMLEEHRYILARGAALLFAANFVGIALAAAAVLLLTRYAPIPRLVSSGWKSAAGLLAGAVVVVLVAIPLSLTYFRLLDNVSLTTAVNEQVAATLGPEAGAVIRHVSVGTSGVTIDIAGGETIPPASVFEADLVDELGPDVSVTIRRS